MPSPEKEEQVCEEGLRIILREGWLGDVAGTLALPSRENTSHTGGPSWEPSQRESCLCEFIFRNCKADVCFGEVHVFPSVLFSKIGRKDYKILPA